MDATTKQWALGMLALGVVLGWWLNSIAHYVVDELLNFGQWAGSWAFDILATCGLAAVIVGGIGLYYGWWT